jgi:hypothetical protein
VYDQTLGIMMLGVQTLSFCPPQAEPPVSEEEFAAMEQELKSRAPLSLRRVLRGMLLELWMLKCQGVPLSQIKSRVSEMQRELQGAAHAWQVGSQDTQAKLVHVAQRIHSEASRIGSVEEAPPVHVPGVVSGVADAAAGIIAHHLPCSTVAVLLAYATAKNKEKGALHATTHGAAHVAIDATVEAVWEAFLEEGGLLVFEEGAAAALASHGAARGPLPTILAVLGANLVRAAVEPMMVNLPEDPFEQMGPRGARDACDWTAGELGALAQTAIAPAQVMETAVHYGAEGLHMAAHAIGITDAQIDAAALAVPILGACLQAPDGHVGPMVEATLASN